MRVLLAVGLLFVSACGGEPPSPESVVRAWAQAVNSENNDAAARLFAANAQVVQDGEARRLRTFEEARRWNASLPCSGRIIELREQGETVRATFVLSNRRTGRCASVRERARTLFRVEDGKIVLWHGLDDETAPPEENV